MGSPQPRLTPQQHCMLLRLARHDRSTEGPRVLQIQRNLADYGYAKFYAVAGERKQTMCRITDEGRQRLSAPCPVSTKRCRLHGYVHCREAEELRSGVEKIIADNHEDADNVVRELIQLLDDVDARDSLAFIEAQPTRRRRRR